MVTPIEPDILECEVKWGLGSITGASLAAQRVKNLSIMRGDVVLIPGSGRFPGEGNGNPLQYSCLENSTEDPGRQQSMESQRVGHDRVTNTNTTNKASGSDGFPAELFQILKDDAVKDLQSICQQIWKTRSDQRTGKGQC